MMLLDLPWYVVFPAGVVGGMVVPILAGYIYGVVEAYRDDSSDSTDTHD